ncbi:MAG: DUF1761 domain-containing protein [Gammaproteobacteria bacterium]
MGLQIIGIVVAAVVMFIFGGIWYSPMLFAKAWARETGITEHNPSPKSVARFSIILFGLSLLAAAILACILTDWVPGHTWLHGLAIGFLGGLLATVATGMNNLFERKRLALFLINGSYQVLGFCIMGILVAMI